MHPGYSRLGKAVRDPTRFGNRERNSRVLRRLFAVFVFFQFLYSLEQDFLVCLVTQIVDEAALFCAQQIPRTSYVEILHGDMYAAA